jgi:CheY-like chemotaxis protein
VIDCVVSGDARSCHPKDHQELAGVLARGLRRDGMAVDVALDGGEGWFKLGVSDYDVVVLDRDLPVLHGDELCRRLRAGDPGADADRSVRAAAGRGGRAWEPAPQNAAMTLVRMVARPAPMSGSL